MKRFRQSILLTSLTFIFAHSYGQIDTSLIDKFLQKQIFAEEDFIAFLKAGRTDSCLNFFSPALLKKYGDDRLKREIHHLTNLFSKFPDPKQTISIGGSFQGVGTFGHDADGRFEKQSLYQFKSKDSIVYYFTLYYTDKDPVTLIKFFDSPNLTDYPFKKIKVPQNTPVHKQGQNNQGNK
jgi:hypothetical protein